MSILLAILSAGPSQSGLLIFPELLYLGPTAQGVAATLSNPAGLWGQGAEFLASGGLWFTDSKASVVAVRKDSWAGRIGYLDYGKFEFQDQTPDDDGGPYFRPYTFEASVYRAFQLASDTRVGIGLGYIHQEIYDHGYTDYHISAGVIHTPAKLPGLALAIGIRNLGIEKVTDLAREALPTQYYAGFSYGRGDFYGACEWSRITRYDTASAYLSLDPLGTELRFLFSYELRDILVPSISYSYGREIDPLELRLGAGAGKIRLSYGFRPSFRGFDPLHLVALEYVP